MERLAEVRFIDETYALEPGETLSIGRHGANDVILDDRGVSRFHATIRWEPHRPRPYVCDNGSQNGTWVNGRELHGTVWPLSDGVTLSIDGNRCTVHLTGCEAPALLDEAEEEVVSLFSETGPEVTGRYASGAELRQVLSLLESERRTGTLSVQGSATPGGRVTFCLGKLMRIEHGEARGTRALEQLLLLDEPGRFRFSVDLEPTGQPLNLRFSEFLRRWGAGSPTSRTGQRVVA